MNLYLLISFYELLFEYTSKFFGNYREQTYFFTFLYHINHYHYKEQNTDDGTKLNKILGTNNKPNKNL